MKRSGGDLGILQDIMCADAAPDDVRLALAQGRAVAERCASVWRPSHFEDARVPLHPFDAQSLAESRSGFQVNIHSFDGSEECVALLLC